MKRDRLPTGDGCPKVVFVTRILTHYRVPFHERVRDLLAQRGVEYRLLHGQPNAMEELKGDLANLPWAEPFRNVELFNGRIVWQPVRPLIGDADMVIVGQENRLLANYPLQLLRRRAHSWAVCSRAGRGGRRGLVALFGHGRNFQSRNPSGWAERWKMFWATRCDWWFGYTEQTRLYVEALGFPSERITVFNNAVDTAALRAAADGMTEGGIGPVASALGLAGGNVAIFVGGIYAGKRIDFLIEAADIVRQRIADFELVVVGGGPGLTELQRMAEGRPWLHLAGPRFGEEKAALMRAARLFVMPGLVGLAVLDAAAMGLPVVTTAWPWHSPEIAYLQDGENGVIVPDWEDVSAYADAVIALMGDDDRRAKLARGARATAGRYTIEAMAERFAAGVLDALASRDRVPRP